MKINNLKYSELNKTIQSNLLVLDLDFKSGNQLFRTEKIFSAKTYRSLNKFDQKHRVLSSAPKKVVQDKDKLNTTKQKQKKLKFNVKSRPVSSNPSAMNQQGRLQKQELISRPRTATNRFYTGLDLKKNNKKQDIFLQLSKQMKRYFAKIVTKQQKNQTLEELKLILNIIERQSQPSIILLHFQRLQNQLSRFLKHRLSHLFFYLIYSKLFSSLSQQNIAKQVKLLTLSEYHARSFYFRKVSLLVCMQIQQKLIKLNDYEESRKYAVKCLKLAVIIQDKYFQVKMLEYLGVLKYYQGVLNSTGSNLLTEQKKINIIKLYNQEEQMPQIFKLSEKSSTFDKGKISVQSNKENGFVQAVCSFDKNQLYFNQGQNYITYGIPSSNLKKFSRNFHGIAKKLNKVNTLKQNIKKVSEIGLVKKFFGKDKFITLQPQGNTFKNTFQSQVFVTHKKYADIQKGKTFIKKQLTSIISRLKDLIMTEMYEHTSLNDNQHD